MFQPQFINKSLWLPNIIKTTITRYMFWSIIFWIYFITFVFVNRFYIAHKTIILNNASLNVCYLNYTNLLSLLLIFHWKIHYKTLIILTKKVFLIAECYYNFQIRFFILTILVYIICNNIIYLNNYSYILNFRFVIITFFNILLWDLHVRQNCYINTNCNMFVGIPWILYFKRLA